MPPIAFWSCPASLKTDSMTEISVAVVSRPVKAVQSAGRGEGQRATSIDGNPTARTVDDHARADHI